MAFINQVNTSNPSASTSLPSPAITISAGNLMVVFVEGNQNTTITLADTGSANTFTQIRNGVFNTPNASLLRAFYAWNTAAVTNDVITATYGTSSAFRQMIVCQYSGIAIDAAPLTASQLGNQTNPGSATDALTSGTDTPVTCPCLIIGYIHDESGSVTGVTAGTNFTSDATPLSGFSILESRVYNPGSAPAAIAATATATSTTGADIWLSCMGVFRIAIPDMGSRSMFVGS